MLGHILWEMWDWPKGLLPGNLIAASIVSAVGFIHLHIRQTKLHKKQMDMLNPHTPGGLGDLVKENTNGKDYTGS